MKIAIKQWFAPPVFEGDETKTRRANFLNAALLMGLSFLGITIPIYFLDDTTRTGIVFILSILFFVILLLRYLMRRGKVALAGSGMVILVFLTIVMIDIINGTAHAPATVVYLFVIIMAGALFEWRGILVSLGACSLAVLGLILAENAGILPPPIHTVTITNWITYTGVFGVIGGVSLWAQQTIQQALARAEQEIKARERVEMELRKLTHAVEQSPASIMITDLDGNIEYVNPRFTQVTGYSFDEARGKNPRILKTNSTSPETYRQLWETITAGQEWHGEFINRKKDGSLYYESASIAPVTDRNGRVVNYVSIKEDITARKQMEDRLLKLSQAVEQSGNSVIIMDKNGMIEYVNPKFTEATGYSAEEVQGKSPTLLSGHGDDYDFTQNEAWKTINAGQIWRGEFLNRHKDGSEFWEVATIAPVHNPSGDIINFVEIKQDITEEKLLQRQIQRQNEYLSVLHQVSLDLLNRHDIHDLFQVIVDRSATLLDAPFSELMIEENGVLAVVAFTDNQPELKGDRVTRAEAKLSWQAFDTHQPVILDDYAVWEHRREMYGANLHAVAEFPIIVGDRCLGILGSGRSQLNYKFTAEQIETGVLFARLAALVLDNANLYEAAMKEMDESRRMEEALFAQNQNLAILHKIIYALLDTRDFTSVLNEIATQAAEIAGASYGYIFLAEGDDLVVRSATGNFASNIGSREKKPGTGVLGKVWQTTKLLVVENYAEWEGRDLSYSKWNLRALAGIPIIGRDGPLGMLGVARLKDDPRKFTSQEIDALVQMTALASLVLDNAQLYEAAMKEIAERTRAEALLRQKSLELESERQKSERLLLNILPVEVAEKLKNNMNLIADHFDEASILFADIVDFTGMSAAMTPNEVVNMLNEIFSKFDEFTERHNLEKIKTIGDCYMVASGAPRLRKDHAHAIARLAVEFQNYADHHLVQGRKLSFRIGIHSGAVIAGVIGQNKFIYDMWGDTVNIASRMESHGTGGSIQVTQATYDLIKDQFACEPRGMISVKGKGDMPVWYLKGEK